MIIASIDDYRKQCEARLPRFLYDYISGGSYQENTLRANIAELQATLLRQRVMVGVPFTLSTMGVCDVHEVAQKTGVPPWFQLYMLKDRGFIKSVIERSISAGSKVLVFTVDLATPGRRYSEVHDGMEKDPTLLGMLGFVAQGATHPRWALDIVTKGRKSRWKWTPRLLQNRCSQARPIASARKSTRSSLTRLLKQLRSG
jgi:L-lactate dehydrogenase (cytochrome)